MAAKKTTAKKAPAKEIATKSPMKVAAKKAAKKSPIKEASTKAPAKKAAGKKAASKQLAPVIPTFEEIASAAYINYLRRIEQGLPGDPISDWVDAERSLTMG